MVICKDKKNRQALKQAHQEKRERTHINTIRNERGETTTDTTEIQRIMRSYYEELCAKKCENIDEVEKFSEKYNLQNLNEDAESLNRPITADEIEAAIKKLSTHKSPGPDGFKGEFYKSFKEKIIPILHRLFEKIQNDGRLPNSFLKPASS